MLFVCFFFLFLLRAQLLRGEVGGVETLHSMLVEDICLISDPDVRALSLFEGQGRVFRRGLRE